MEVFSNNAKVILTTGISDTDTDVYLDSGTDTSSINSAVSQDNPQRFTIAHAGHPELPPEIVLVNFHDPVYPRLKFVRGLEGTTPQTWPAGSVMTGRVTAEMLAAFAPKETADILGKKSVVRKRVISGRGPVERSVLDDDATLVKASLLRGKPAPRHFASHPSTDDGKCSLEVVKQSGVYDFGVPPLHSDTELYFPGDVVRPATPDGYQYTLYQPDDVDQGITGVVTFSSDTYVFDANNVVLGAWARTADPVDITDDVSSSEEFGQGMILSECGIVLLYSQATTPPSFSIGVPGDATAFASAQAATFTEVTAGNNIGLLRILVPTTFQKIVQQVTIKVTTAADAPCRGYFYCKGIEVYPY